MTDAAAGGLAPAPGTDEGDIGLVAGRVGSREHTAGQNLVAHRKIRQSLFTRSHTRMQAGILSKA